MPELVRDEVMGADAAWVWAPPEAETVETDDYLLAFYPTYWADPTQVIRTGSARPASELVEEVRGHATSHERPDVVWWVHDLVEPSGLEEHLVSLGGERVETLTVLAKALDEPIPHAPDEPEVRPVTDRASVMDSHRVAIEVFDEKMPPEADIDREVERYADPDGEAMLMVAYVDGAPVGMGGVTVVDGAARLWGGGTVPAARRQGVYAAMLRARLNWALEHGAGFALTRGRIETSAPILRREGFGVFGEKRSYRVHV